jgi:hypothetical protein
MTQQTAVEYLIEKLFTEYRFEFSGTIVDQAKQMEKEQIMKTWYDCKYITIIDKIPMDAEEYYNETYESK